MADDIRKAGADMTENSATPEKQSTESERRAEAAVEQKRAELEYAEDYRKKLQRDKKRAETAEREEREAEYKAAREAREKEIAQTLEKDRLEAASRGERASALLEKIRAARNEKREAESVAQKNEETVTPPVTDTSDTDQAADPDTAGKTDAESQNPEGDLDAEGAKLILDILDDRIVLDITESGAAISGPVTSGVHIHEITPYEMLAREGMAVSVNQNVTVATEDDRASEDEIIDAKNPEYDDPITSENPDVAAIKLLGRSVSTKSSFRKYINESKNTVKDLNKQITVYENALLIDNITGDSAASTLVEILRAVGAVVEIRCDNLRIVTKFAQRRYIPEIKKLLFADIERYNVKVSEFATRTGERLTRLSPSLVNRISDGTGAEVIPTFSYNKKYVELREDETSASSGSLVINLPIGTGEESTAIPVTPVASAENSSHIYTLTPVYPVVFAADLLHGAHASDKKSYKAYLKIASKASRKINTEISKLSSGIDRAQERGEELDKKLNRRRAALDKMLETMDHGFDSLRNKKDRALQSLDKEREKCESIEKKIELNRTYLENERSNADIAVGCLVLEREKLIVSLNTLIAAKTTSSNKIISAAKNELIAEMSRYNKALDECSRYIDIELTPVTSAIVDDIMGGKKDVKIPAIAQLRELCESVGGESRIIGARAEKAAPASYTISVNAPQGNSGKKKTVTPIRTVHGRFFMGGVAPGNIAGADRSNLTVATAAAAVAVPAASAVAGEPVDSGVAVGAAAGGAYAIASSESKLENMSEDTYAFEPVAEEEPSSIVYQLGDEPAVADNAYDSVSEPIYEETPEIEETPAEAEYTEPEEPFAVEEPVIIEEPDIIEEPEAPIAESTPRKIRRRVVDEGGKESFTEEPCPEKLVEDEFGDISDEPIIYEDKIADEPDTTDLSDTQIPSEPVSEPLDGLSVHDSEPPKKKKIKLRQLPPPEKSEKAAEELRPVTDDEPIFPGNTVRREYIDEDDFDPKDSTKIPSIVEVDDGDEEIENDILLKPTKHGLRKHLAKVNRKIRKAIRERSRLQSKKRHTEGIAAKARVYVDILCVQKRIIDWYINAETSCCDLGSTRKARRIAGALRSELKRYNRYVKEYEKLTGDRLTEASLEIPKLILEGEDYQTIPKIKIREVEAPEEGVVYGDGVTENADYVAEYDNDIVMTEKDLNKRLNESSREISRLHGELEKKLREKHNTWGIDKTVCTVECFGIQKKIIDTLAGNLRAACQVSSVKKIQSIKRELSAEIKEYNRLVKEYKTVSGNSLTMASENIAQDIIAGNLYIPVPRVGCIYMNEDEDLDGDLRAMSQNSYGVEDGSGVGGIAFRTKVTSQANKDLSLITKRADYQISMLESERDILAYRFGKDPSDVKREKREISKKISSIRAAHKSALGFENNDNRRYYAAVTANPMTMELKNKRADRARVAAVRAKIIDLLNERDIVNGKLIALYTGAKGTFGNESINQEWRRIKNRAALKSKNKQRDLAEVVKHLPITTSEKIKVYSMMNEKIDAESTLALSKHRLKKENLHKEDKLCAKQDIRETRAKIKEINKRIDARIKEIKGRIADAEATTSWYISFLAVLVIAVVGIIAYFYYIGPYIVSLFG